MPVRPRAHPLAWLALALALIALAVPAGAAAAGTVSVTGRATLEVPNDSARAGFGVSTVRSTKGAALRAASARLRAVIVAVQKVPGVGDGDIRTGAVRIGRVSRGAEARYRATQGITVTLHEASRAGELVAAAIAAGAAGVRGPYYFVGDTEAAYGRALAAAFQRARGKAALLATQAGATLGPAQTIVEAGAIEPPTSAPAAGKGATPEEASSDSPPPTKPRTSTVTATVNVVFALL